MSRSIWKEPFSLLKAQQLVFLQKDIPLKQPQKSIEVWSRTSMILPEHIGKDVKIYNGKNWAFRKIIEEMVGHKFGEFCSTRKKTVHKIKKTSVKTTKKK